MVRAVRTTDFLALLSSGIGSFLNEAAARDRLGKDDGRRSSLEALLKPWLAVDQQRSAVCFDGGRVVGFATARCRAGRSAWEVAALAVAADSGSDIGRQLLDHLAADVGLGVERLFLRLRHDSPLVDAARQAGFCTYAEECFYGIESKGSALNPTPVAAPYTVTVRSAAHRLELYDVFATSVPAAVRSAEGLTWREWRDSRERHPGRRRAELWLAEGGASVSWLGVTVSGPSGHLELVGQPEVQALAALLDEGLRRLERSRTIYCLVADYQQDLAKLLCDRGFMEVGAYCLMVRQIAVLQRAPALAVATSLG